MRVLTVLIAAGLLAGFWSLTQPDELPPGHSVDMSVGGAELTSLEASVDLSGTSRAAITGRAILRCAIGSRATLSLSSSGTSDLSIDVEGADARALSLTNSLLCGQERVVVDFDGSVARQQIESSLGSNRTFFDVSLRGISYDSSVLTPVRLTVLLDPYSRFENTYGPAQPDGAATSTTWLGGEQVQASAITLQPDVGVATDRLVDLMLVGLGTLLGVFAGPVRRRRTQVAVAEPTVTAPAPSRPVSASEPTKGSRSRRSRLLRARSPSVYPSPRGRE